MASTNFIPGQLTIRGCEIASNKEVEFAVEELLFTIQSLYRTQARKRLSVVCHSVTVLSVGGTGTPEEEEGTSSTKTLQVSKGYATVFLPVEQLLIIIRSSSISTRRMKAPEEQTWKRFATPFFQSISNFRFRLIIFQSLVFWAFLLPMSMAHSVLSGIDVP